MATRTVAALCGVATTLALAAPGLADGPTTVDQTIVDADGDNVLSYGPGEDYVVREDLGRASPNRAQTRERLIHIGQLTDFQLADEESPARVEWLDSASQLFAGAYRPEEVAAGQVIESMVQRLRDITSPVDGAPVDNFLVTGDSADSRQQNETRDFIDTLDGGRVSPDSGRRGWQYPCSWGWLLEPYAGVRGGGQFYEPDSSGPPGAGSVDGPGYAPDEGENQAERGRSVAVRDYPGFLRAANRTYTASGLDAPWYSVFGNHDGLVQGNIPNPLLGFDWDLIAKGCLKIMAGDAGKAGLDPLRQAMRAYMARPDTRNAQTLRRQLSRVFGSRNPMGLSIVPEDPQRHIVTHEEWVQEHFNTTGTPVGHGFADRPGPGQAYYSTSPKPGLRYIGLDSVDQDGLANGVIDDEQFRWLESEIAQAQQNAERVIVFAHHTLATMDNGWGNLFELVHFGTRDQNGVPPHRHGESLEQLFLRYPAVIAYVSGHEHDNKITPFSHEGEPGRFWEIATAAHIDWPGQSRLIEVFDNQDGTLSIFGTLVDHAARPDPGSSPNLNDPLDLASIARELTWNDWQASTGEDGRPDARGRPEDRNVELLLDISG